MNALRRTAGLTAILIFGMIVLGGVVRTTNSGLSCPDWPTCYGYWLPLPSLLEQVPNMGYEYYQVMLEWVHRLIGGVVLGPLVLVVAFLGWRHRAAHPRLAVSVVLMVLLLLVQGLLGGLTVLDRNSPWSVAIHLGNALILLVIAVGIHDAARTRAPTAAAAPGWIRPTALAAMVTALLAMMSAAITAKSGASLACYTWPSCNGGLVPDWSDGGEVIHMIHRYLAAAFAVSLVVLLVGCLRDGRVPQEVRRQSMITAILVCIQIMFGALVIVLEVPIWKAVLHQATGVLTFALVADLFWRARSTAAAASYHLSGGLGAASLR
ncbi:COX15/CtaA family protein [Geminicoccus roseus]|uniref:COX15/CtaA family protein n=1 Tax=Geminicoccus roseus TaxID=404900 RepID=UPI00042562E7|nr:COX15/CtaA family protein [Geminicoccus roseus]